MNEFEFKAIIEKIFGNIYISNNICTIPMDKSISNIHIILLDNIAFIKTPISLRDDITRKNDYYTFVCATKEELIEKLIILKSKLFDANYSVNVDEILEYVNQINNAPITKLKQRSFALVNHFDSLLYPFNNNPIYDFRLNGLDLLSDTSINCSYNNPRNYTYKFKKGTTTLSFNRSGDFIRSSLTNSNDKYASINIEHEYIDNYISLLNIMENIDKDICIKLTYDLINGSLKNDKDLDIDIKPIHLELINEELAVVNHMLEHDFIRSLHK